MNRPGWLRGSLLAAAIVLCASLLLSLALHLGLARRFLTAQLAASFGRPVQVAYFDFSLLDGLKLEAHSVEVMEDPRFGEEYFLRADELTASPRWLSLLGGRVEFGTVSLTGASLNLVTADGHWNIESWLPPARSSPATQTFGPSPVPAVRLQHISVDGGRINFKRGVEKIAFALVDVSGALDQDNAGRWSIDLQARPARASVALQNTGTLWLRGTVAGTSARLRPAALSLTWEDASVADAVRLATGSDYGVRGSLGAEFSAKIDDGGPNTPTPTGAPAPAASTDSGWAISGVLRLVNMHRWDLSEVDEDPDVNLNVTAAWRPGSQGIEFPKLIVESTHSHMTAAGEVSWAHGFSPRLELTNSQVALEDLLDWRRAFLPGIAEGLQAQGVIGASATLAGWPPRVEQAALGSAGATLRVGNLPEPVRVGALQAAFVRGALVLKPVDVRLPGIAQLRAARGGPETPAAPSGTLRAEGSLGPLRDTESPANWPYRLAVTGDTSRAQDVLAVLAAVGRAPSLEWSVEGPASFQLAWSGALGGGVPATTGTLKLQDMRVNSVLLSQPVLVGSATIDLRPGEKLVKIDAAQALGARWKGTMEWRAPDDDWIYDLSADRLDVAKFSPWIAARAAPGFFERVFPPAASASLPTAREAAVARLQAHGRLRAAEVAVGPIVFANLDADTQWMGRNLALRRAQAEFYGGRVSGTFEARFATVPAYAVHGELSRVNLAAFAAMFPSLPARVAGSAGADFTLSAHGGEVADLLASLQGDASLRVREPILRGLAVSDSPDFTASPESTAENRFTSATASFHIAGGAIHADQFSLVARDQQFELTGSVDFAGQLDLRVQQVPAGSPVVSSFASGLASGFSSGLASGGAPPVAAEASAEVVSGPGPGHDAWVVGGTLDAPKVSRQTSLAGERVGVPAGRR